MLCQPRRPGLSVCARRVSGTVLVEFLTPFSHTKRVSGTVIVEFLTPFSHRRSVVVRLSQAGAQAQHQLHTFELVEPVLKRRRRLALVGRRDAGRAGGAELLHRQGAVATEGAVAVDGA